MQAETNIPEFQNDIKCKFTQKNARMPKGDTGKL